MRIFPVKDVAERSRTTSRTVLLLESAIVLGLVSCAFAFEWRRFSDDKDLAFPILLIAPGTATAAYLFVGTLVPNLVAANRIKWPLVVTLPVVYGALLQLGAALWQRGPNPLVRQELFSRSSEFWQHLEPAGALIGCQIVVLGVWAFIAKQLSGSE